MHFEGICGLKTELNNPFNLPRSPFWMASWKGVSPSSPAWFMEPSCSCRSRIASREAEPAAQCIGLQEQKEKWLFTGTVTGVGQEADRYLRGKGLKIHIKHEVEREKDAEEKFKKKEEYSINID